MDAAVNALLPPAGIDALRTALTHFTAQAVADTLGMTGQALLARGDTTGVRRQLPGAERTATLIRLFLLGDEVGEAQARAAIEPLRLDEAEQAGLLLRSAQAVRATVDIRPYAEDDPLERLTAGHRNDPTERLWWVVSDFGSDVRPGPLAADHVLGVGAAALTLAQATVRDDVSRAADIGTGCGVQSLHLSRHCAAVTATDISQRALRFAATTAALSGVRWDLRRGSLVQPLAGDRFELVVANPPFVVSAGLSRTDGGHDYRDSGLAGDALCERLIADLPAVLSPGGVAQMLANWVITRTGDWAERLREWLLPTGCDAWVWQREVADPAEYVALWLSDAGHRPGTPAYANAYGHWLDWFARHDVAAIGMGMITMWRPEGDPSDDPPPPASDAIIVCEDVRQPLGQPVGRSIQPWHRRMHWLRHTDDAAMLDTCLTAADDLVVEMTDVHTALGWERAAPRLRQSHGLRWEIDTDDAFVAVLRGCDGTTPSARLIAVLAAAVGGSPEEVAGAALPVLRDLVQRGFVEPVVTR